MLTELFQYYTSEMLDIFCPAKVVVSRPGEKPWVTEEIKILKRRVQRQYERKGQSPKYLELKCSYDAKMKAEAQKYTEKIQKMSETMTETLVMQRCAGLESALAKTRHIVSLSPVMLIAIYPSNSRLR